MESEPSPTIANPSLRPGGSGTRSCAAADFSSPAETLVAATLAPKRERNVRRVRSWSDMRPPGRGKGKSVKLKAKERNAVPSRRAQRSGERKEKDGKSAGGQK